MSASTKIRPDPAASVAPSVLSRLVAAGLSDKRARAWIRTGGARVDNGVTDVDAPAHVVLHSS